MGDTLRCFEQLTTCKSFNATWPERAATDDYYRLRCVRKNINFPHSSRGVANFAPMRVHNFLAI